MSPRPAGVGGGVASTENIGNISTLKAWRARECCGVTYGGWREGGMVGRVIFTETGWETGDVTIRGLPHRSVIVQCVPPSTQLAGVRGEGVFLWSSSDSGFILRVKPDKSQYHSQYKLSFGQRSLDLRPPTATSETIWKLGLDLMRH